MYVKAIVAVALIAGLVGTAVAQGSCGHPTTSCPAGQIWDAATGKCQQMTVVG